MAASARLAVVFDMDDDDGGATARGSASKSQGQAMMTVSGKEGQSRRLPLAAGMLSETLRNQYNDILADGGVMSSGQTDSSSAAGTGADEEFKTVLPNVPDNVLELVISYCVYKHSKMPPAAAFRLPQDRTAWPTPAPAPLDYDAPICQWQKHIVDIDPIIIHGLANAATYLDIPELLYITCYTIAERNRGKIPSAVRHNMGVSRVAVLSPQDRATVARILGDDLSFF